MSTHKAIPQNEGRDALEEVKEDDIVGGQQREVKRARVIMTASQRK